MSTDCPECGGENTSTIPQAGPAGKAVVKCFGECDGERHVVEEYEKPQRTTRQEPDPEPEEKQTSLSDW